MSRLPEISVEGMNERQRPIYDKIVSGKRGHERFSAPFNVWIYSPGFLERLEKVGSYLRGDTTLPPRLIEMAVLKPRDRMEFESVHGVGAAKLEKYGEVFLGAIATHQGFQQPSAPPSL